jgi:small conductance mechanosensitive channel
MNLTKALPFKDSKTWTTNKGMSSLSLVKKSMGSPAKGPETHDQKMKFFEPQLRTYSIIRIAVVIVTAGLIIAMVQFTTKPLQRFLDCSSDTSSCQSSKRIQTIMSITVSFIIAIVAVVGVGFVLNIVGIKLGSILAGAGILGLIIGLGAQSVIKDVVTGMLIISENQISEGDYVYITNAKGDQIQGTVKSLSVRLVKISNDEGSEVFIPSGNILHIANASRANQIVTVTVNTPIGTDVRSITDALQSLVAQLVRDPVISGKLLVQPQVGGVNSLDGSSYTTQIQTRVAAGNQWTVGNYIRLQVVEALQNLEVHAPQVFVNIDKLPFLGSSDELKTNGEFKETKKPGPVVSEDPPAKVKKQEPDEGKRGGMQQGYTQNPPRLSYPSRSQAPSYPQRPYGIQQIHQIHSI